MSVPRAAQRFLLCLLCLAGIAAAESEVDHAAVRRHADALIACGDRSPGTTGAKAAADYIVTALQGIGLPEDSIFRKTSTLITQVDREDVQGRQSHLQVGETVLRVYPHLPNAQAPSSTYGQAISGPLRYLGAGDGASLRGAALEGAIAVLDSDSGSAWLRCAELGAQAVIFVHPERMTAIQMKKQTIQASLDLPRFVLPDWQPSLNGTEATLRSSVALQEVTAESIVTRINGTGDDKEAVVLTAGYESAGNVLGLDIAATRAWNAGLLLALTERFAAEPIDRDVILIWNGARIEAFRGLHEILGGLSDVERNTNGDSKLIAALQWPGAPLGNAEAVNIAIETWRTDIIAKGFEEWLAGDDHSEETLKKLIKTFDKETGLPEQSGYFDGLDYRPSAGGGTDGGEAIAEPSIPVLGWIGFAFMILIGVALITLWRRVEGFTTLALVICLVPVVLMSFRFLQKPKTFGGTDSGLEETRIEKLGLKFVAEEAGRRADALDLTVENLRLLDSLIRKWDADELAAVQGNPDRLNRWELEHKSMYEARQFLEANKVDTLPDESFEPASDRLREHINKLMVEQRDAHQRWRNIQQKLGRAELSETELPFLPELVKAIASGGKDSILSRHREVLKARFDDFKSTIELRKGLGDPEVTTVIALDLADGNDRFSSITKGWLLGWSLVRLHKQVGNIASTLNAQTLDGKLAFEDGPYEMGEDTGSWWHSNYYHEGMVAGWFGHALTLSTVNDYRYRVGSPADTAANFNADNFLRQTDGLAPFIRAIITDPSIRSSKHVNRPSFIVGQASIETRSAGSVDGKKGYPFPMVTAYMGTTDAVNASFQALDRDVRMQRTMRGDAFGVTRMPWLPKSLKNFAGSSGGKGKFGLDATGHDEAGRVIVKMVTDGVNKGKMTDNSGFDLKKPRNLLVNVFECQSSQVYGIFDPRLMKGLSAINVLSSARESKPDYAHVESDANMAVIFTAPGVRLRVLAAEGEVGNRFLLLGDHLFEDEFRGLVGGGSLATEPQLGDQDGKLSEADVDKATRNRVPTAMAASADTLALCKHRLERYQKNGINPEATWGQLAKSQRHQEAAEQAFAAGDLEMATAHGQASWSYLTNVYPTVLSTGNDVVYGLVVMLLLAIPFALICERLFISGNTIGKKIAGFSSFFILVFFFFYFLHPAFDLATTPVIIFLAFVVILLSVLVIGLLYNRFEHEMQLIRMSGMGTHTADVARFGTILATGQLGISNMRRRPLRTLLTAITVVLMTFILLTFSSFKGSADTRQLSLGVPPNYNGVLLHKSGWVALEDTAIDRVQASWGDKLDIHQRWWISANDARKRLNIEGAETAYVEGLIAISDEDPSGVARCLVRGALGDADAPRGFGDDGDWIFLPPLVIELMESQPGDTVLFQGLPLKLGVIDSERFASITHLGGDPITPLSLTSMSEEQREEMKQQTLMAASGETSVEGSSFTHLGPESTGVIHLSQAKRFGAELKSFAMVPYTPERAAAVSAVTGRELTSGDQVDVAEVAEDMAHQLAMTLTVGDRGDTYLLTSVSGVSVSGLTDVLIPLILGGLIIFSTMLGSVAERGKEIFIYSSLGLAPLHIGALFLVEASIYAVLGGLGGYIIAQLLVAGLGFLAQMGIGVQPDLNYSSLTAVATIILVMATVLLSALYPAFVASNAAKPGEDTDFTVPEADGDNLEIPFPFTVARRDVQGLLAFLKAYFDTNGEASVGCFTSADASMQSDVEAHAHEVTAKTWLAPFDLGISQSFRLRAEQTELKAIYRIHISLGLLSGQRNAWRRVVFPFLKELRKQFLVWRTLDEITMDRYRAEGGDTEAAERVKQFDIEEAEAQKRAEAEMNKRKQDIKQALVEKNENRDGLASNPDQPKSQELGDANDEEASR